MEVRKYEILDKVKENELYLSNTQDFEISEESESVDGERLLSDPKITHYCFDEEGEHAVFIESDTVIDVRAEPFLFVAQYRAATFLYTMEIETFCHLASKIEIQNERVSFVHSVGRCGSTLISKALASVPTVMSYSEPDAFTNLLILRWRDSYNDQRLQAVTDASVRWTLRPSLHADGISHYSIKFRSQVTELASVLAAAFPNCKNLFLYRDAESWLSSAYRAFVDQDLEDDEEYRQVLQDFFGSVHAVVSEYLVEGKTLPVTQTWFLSWISVVESYLESSDKGINWMAANFDQIKRNPQRIVAALLEYCGIELEDWDDMNRVLIRDSQSGTQLAKKEIGHLKSIPAEESKRLRGLLMARPIMKKLENGVPHLIQV